MYLIKSKKAQGINYVAVTIVLLVFGILSVFFYFIFLQFTVELATAGYYTGQAKIVGDQFLDAFLAADYLIIFLLVGLIVAIGITSFKIATKPIFFVITFIMGIFWGFISYIFNYVFIRFMEDPVIHTASLLFPRTWLVCTNLHWVALACIVVGSVTLYGKRSEKGQGLI